MARRRRRRARRARANPFNPIANRRRRRGRRNPLLNRRRRRGRRNPPNGGGMSLVGVRFPGMQSVLYGTVGFMGPPFIEGFAGPYLPTQLTTTQWGRYLVKIGSVVGLSWAAGAFAGRDAGVKVATGGAIYMAATLINDFMPAVTTQPATAYYPRLAAQPLLGDYGRSRSMTAAAPARLQPQGRY